MTLALRLAVKFLLIGHPTCTFAPSPLGGIELQLQDGNGNTVKKASQKVRK